MDDDTKRQDIAGASASWLRNVGANRARAPSRGGRGACSPLSAPVQKLWRAGGVSGIVLALPGRRTMAQTDEARNPAEADWRVSSPHDSLFRTQNTPIAPEVGTKPRGGRPQISATAADKKRAYRQRQKRRQNLGTPPLPAGPYRVLYADPHGIMVRAGYHKYGYASCHYPVPQHSSAVPNAC